MRLIKPGIIFGNLVTALGGFFLASRGNIDYRILLLMILGLSCIIASGCVFNNVSDRLIDEKMLRTKNRPLVTGSISTNEAILIGLALFFCAVLVFFKINMLSLVVGLSGFIIYVFFYTPLKKTSVHATLVGSLSGAMPPVVGYCSVSNRLDGLALLLFIILVFWQMPHFYAIAMYRLSEYEQANVPILPKIKGVYSTKIHIIFYAIGFAISVVTPSILGYMGKFNLLISALMGISWLVYAFLGLKADCDIKWAKNMFRFSLVIVMLMSLSWSLQ